MVWTLTEDVKKRWQEYTAELYKQELHDLDNHDGVITHLEPDILECEVKWALERLLLVNENCVSHPIRPPHILCEGCSFITQDVCI